jgi:hypothetical protein
MRKVLVLFSFVFGVCVLPASAGNTADIAGAAAAKISVSNAAPYAKGNRDAFIAAARDPELTAKHVAVLESVMRRRMINVDGVEYMTGEKFFDDIASHLEVYDEYKALLGFRKKEHKSMRVVENMLVYAKVSDNKGFSLGNIGGKYYVHDIRVYGFTFDAEPVPAFAGDGSVVSKNLFDDRKDLKSTLDSLGLYEPEE